MKKLLFLVLLSVSALGYSQDGFTHPKDELLYSKVKIETVDTTPEPNNIDPQRPTITESNTLVKQGRLQFENGYDVNLDNTVGSLGTFVRYGLASNLELRMATNFVDSGINIGVKFKLFDIDKLNTGTAFIIDYNTLGGSFYKAAITIGLTDDVYVNYNLVYQDNVDFYHVALLGYSHERCGAFVEWTDNSNTNRVHAGATYRATNSLQVDLNGGYFMDLKTSYVGAGLSFFVQ